MKTLHKIWNRHMNWNYTTTLLSVLAISHAQVARAGCPAGWLENDGAPGVVGIATVFASTTFDLDGAGPQAPMAIFGGTLIGAGDIAVNALAAWDGAEWHALGDGLNGQVRALTVYNGQLIAAAGHNGFGNLGPANGVASFDGTTWQPVGSGGFQNVVWALAVYNGDLIAGGLFNSAGGAPVTNIARWNGTSWSAFGSLPIGCTALTVYNGELLAASNGVLRWTGTSWVAFGPNLTGNVKTFATYNGELVAGGSFQTVPGTPTDEVARWDGAAWQPLGGGMSDNVNALIEYNGELIAGGTFTNVEGAGAFRMARWNGASWFPIFPGPGMPVRRCDSLLVYNGELYAGGAETLMSGLQSEQVGRWNGSQWSYVGDGIDAIVYDLATYDGDLIAGGWFTTAGDVSAYGLARRDASGQWHALGNVSGGNGLVSDLVVYDDTLIACGSFTSIDGVPIPNNIAQWNGKFWQPFGDALVYRGLVHNGVLFALGEFGPNVRVARWNPASQTWVPLGTFPANSGASCLAIFNGDLIAGGLGVTANVWRWDFDAPGIWHPLGQHLGFASVLTLAEYNGELYAGGYIDDALLRFNGTSWETVGGGLFLSNDIVAEVLAVFDLRIYNGELIVAGSFAHAGEPQYSENTVMAYHIARWNGSNWQAFEGVGMNDASVALHEHDGDLIIGGWFTMAAGSPAGHLARFGPICKSAPGDVNGDGLVNVLDLLGVIGAWGPCLAPPCSADLDSNGLVNVLDLLIVIGNWR